MGLILHAYTAGRLPEADLAPWWDVPVAIAGDELNRAQVMQAAVKPLRAGAAFVGQAVTVRCMVGDNLPLHHALAGDVEGAVLVVDGRAHTDTALWGGVMQASAKARGVAAVVIDGAVRDLADLRRHGPPVYCRAVCPAGPHKGFGGEVNGPIQCGGVPVAPGDLVLGDEDGVVVIHRDQLDGLLARCQARLAKEASVIADLEAGRTTVELYNLPGPGEVG